MSEPTPELRVVTPPGQGALSAIAVRGSAVAGWLAQCFEPKPTVGRPSYGRLRDEGGEVIDDVVVLALSSDELLITLHGNPRLVERVVDRLRALGARSGSPSIEEWGGHPALSSALALSANAPTAAGGRFLIAQAQLWQNGSLARELDSVATEQIEAMLQRARGALPFESPPRIAIVGVPNAGKSTLLNRLLGWERMVVDPTPGTTRDRIEVEGVVADRPVVWIDGAGLRSEGDSLERAGMDRIREAARTADLIVQLIPVIAGEAGEDYRADSNAFLLDPLSSDRPTLRVVSQIDRLTGDRETPRGDCAVSAVTGEGIDRFLGAVAKMLFGGEDLPAEVTPFTRAQCDRLRDVLARRGNGAPDLDLWPGPPPSDRGENP